MSITKQQAIGIKGFAIIIVITHNLLRVLDFKECNELDFIENIQNYPPQLQVFPLQLISYYGYIILTAFIFISGYGLMTKYGDSNINIRTYIIKNLSKLYLLFVPCFILCVILGKLNIINFPLNLHATILQATCLINFLFPKYTSYFGPYWYMGVALQLYLWFLIFRKLSSNQLITLAILCAFVIQLSCSLQLPYTTWLRRNSFGWLHIFLLGMYLSKNKLLLLNTKILNPITCIICMLITGIYRHTWIASELFGLLAIINLRNTFTSSFLIRLGLISSSMYVIHPLLRAFITSDTGKSDLFLYGATILFLIITFAVSFVYDKCIKKIQSFVYDYV